MALTRSERSAAEEARHALERAGFPLVQQEVPLGSGGSWRADLVAWAPNTDGELVPQALVELKRRHHGSHASALSQLARAASVLGTLDAYLFDGEQWLRAEAHFSSLEPVAGPVGPLPPDRAAPRKPDEMADHDVGVGVAHLTDPVLLQRLLSHRLWTVLDAQRSKDFGSASVVIQLTDYVRSLLQERDLLTVGDRLNDTRVRVDRRTLFEVVLQQVLEVMSPRRLSAMEFGSDQRLVETMVRLAQVKPNWTVADPFCGIGTVLWRLDEWARQHEIDVEITGVDINESVTRLSSALASLSGGGISIHHEDALEWLEAQSLDAIVTQPPFNRSLREPQRIWDTQTLEFEPLALARCADALRPGGRAVIHTVRGWLWREKDASFRQLLSARVRIVALIGLPEGLITATSIPSAIIVIEKSEPTETLVADLRDDWYEQLSPTGSCWQRYADLVGRY